MTTLNLTANGKPQELILAYLQENASDVLAEKINNGTPIEKDGKQLINKKTLDGFMSFASDEAKKLAEKNARSACVEDSVVYGWAIHYFEEDSIEGKLFNEDGTEYKPIVKTAPRTTTKPVKVEPPQPKQQQASLWDMITTEEKKTVTLQAHDDEVMEQAENRAENTLATLIKTNGKTIDTNTGEVMDEEEIEELTESEMREFDGDIQEPKSVNEPTETVEQDSTFSPSSFDEDTAIYLLKLLDGKMTIA